MAENTDSNNEPGGEASLPGTTTWRQHIDSPNRWDQSTEASEWDKAGFVSKALNPDNLGIAASSLLFLALEKSKEGKKEGSLGVALVFEPLLSKDSPNIPPGLSSEAGIYLRPTNPDMTLEELRSISSELSRAYSKQLEDEREM